MKLGLNMKSVSEMRQLAAAVPVTIENIVNDTERLFQVYQSVSDSLGVHEEQFVELLNKIKFVQEAFAEDLKKVPNEMNATADKIEEYIRTHPTTN